MVTLGCNIRHVEAQPRTWTVDDDGSADFHTIQDAIDAATSGDTIYVHNGVYTEHLVVDKSLTLMGEESGLTIINGTLSETAIKITADNVQISNFTIQEGYEGIHIVNSDENTISENTIISNEFEGLWAENSTNNLIADNIISYNGWDGIYMDNVSHTNLRGNTIVSNNGSGVWLDASHDNSLEYNTMNNNEWEGVHMYIVSCTSLQRNTIVSNNGSGVWLDASHDNSLKYNTVSNNEWEGFYSRDSSSISFVGNTVSWNQYAGVTFDNVSACTYHHNDFLNNSRQVISDNSTNAWDNGAEGNYWNDYTSSDLYKGPYQNVTGSDGIGDTSYFIDTKNSDSYPFMGRIDSLEVGTWDGTSQTASIASNSTVSDLRFNNTERLIRFNVTGENSIGFSRVTVPEAVVQGLWQVGYTVLIDGEEPLILDEGTIEAHIYIYLTYLHSEHEIVIKGIPIPDTTPPTITILSPENKTYATNDVALNLTINEPISWIGCSLDNQDNVTISGNITMVELPQGVHMVTVYANDTAGNTGASENLHFSIEVDRDMTAVLSPELIIAVIVTIALGVSVLVYLARRRGKKSKD